MLLLNVRKIQPFGCKFCSERGSWLVCRGLPQQTAEALDASPADTASYKCERGQEQRIQQQQNRVLLVLWSAWLSVCVPSGVACTRAHVLMGLGAADLQAVVYCAITDCHTLHPIRVLPAALGASTRIQMRRAHAPSMKADMSAARCKLTFQTWLSTQRDLYSSSWSLWSWRF